MNIIVKSPCSRICILLTIPIFLLHIQFTAAFISTAISRTFTTPFNDNVISCNYFSSHCHGSIKSRSFASVNSSMSMALGISRYWKSKPCEHITNNHNLEANAKSTNLFRQQKVKGIIRAIRRSFVTLLTYTSLCFSLLSFVSSQRPPLAHASTATVSTTTTTKPTKTRTQPSVDKSKALLDRLIDNYVEERMFSDDEFDPLESAYRETVADIETNEYPTQLSQAASSALGLGKVKSLLQAPSSSKSSTSTSTQKDGKFVQFVLRKVEEIHAKYGISKSFLYTVVGVVCCGVPALSLCALLISFSMRQRLMTERMAIKRYGESVLSAEDFQPEEDDEDDDENNFEYDDGKEEEDDDDDYDDEDDDDE